MSALGGDSEALSGDPIIKHNGAKISDAAQVTEVVVDLDATRPSMFILRFLMSMGAGSDANLNFKIGDTIEVSEASSSKTLIKGEVTAVEAEYGSGGQTLTVRGLDKSHRLHRTRKQRKFVDVTDSDLASQVGADSGLSVSADSTTTTHKYIAQVNQTDWEFLKWRADENGFMLYVDETETLHFKKQPTGDYPAVTLSVTKDLYAFRPRLSAPPVSKVTVTGYDLTGKAAFTGSGTVGSSNAASLQDSPGSLAGTFGSNEHVTSRRSVDAATDVNDLATALASRYADSFVDAEAVAYGSKLMLPGNLVEITEAGDQFNGKYRITAAKHVFNADHRWRVTMRFTGLENRSLLGMTNGISPVATRVPRIEGLVTGIVTDNNDAEGKLFRVKVKFPWLDSVIESDWMRTVQPGAGKLRGSLVLPEVGDEVVIGFEQGDVRRGYVLGGTYNGVDAPFGTLGDSVINNGVARRGFASLKGHLLSFEDSDSASGIHLLTGDTNYEFYLDQQNKVISIDSKQGKVTIHGKMDIEIKSDANVTIEATGNLNLKGTGGVKIESPAQMAIEGATTSVKGNGKLDLDGGGMATLKGGLVKIN